MTDFEQFEIELGLSLHQLEMLKMKFQKLVLDADDLNLNQLDNFWSLNYLSAIHSDLCTATNRALELYAEPFKQTESK